MSSFTDAVRQPESGIVFRARNQATAPKARVLLLHGVGSNEENMASIASQLPSDLEVLLLRGPIQVTPQGYAWYLVKFTSDGPLVSFEQAESSRKQLCQFIQMLPPLPTVIAGFSQGGIMSASVGVTEPELVKGMAILSGRILREIAPQMASPERLKDISAFIAHGYLDGVLPIDWANEADAWLSKIGIEHETHFYDMAHEISSDELEDFSRWLAKTLPLSY